MTITSGTPSWDRIFATESFQSRLFTKAVERFPQGKPPSAGEVADVAVFLAADAAQVTGQTVSVNGGLSFGGW
jgi:3-oxoacyl-[acyl-carrier protein] reductase